MSSTQSRDAYRTHAPTRVLPILAAGLARALAVLLAAVVLNVLDLMWPVLDPGAGAALVLSSGAVVLVGSRR